jgi:tetratricopeptide (TPR) repeat protein
LLYLALIAAGLLFVRFQDTLNPPFIPTPTPTRTAQSYVAEGQAQYEAGRFDGAIDAYTQAIALDPNRVDEMVKLSRILALAGRTEESIRRAQRAVQLDPKSAAARAALAMAYDWHGTWLGLHGRDAQATEYYQKAATEAQAAIQIDPKYPEAYAYLAEAQTDLGRLLEAIDTANQAVELDARRPDVQRALGYVRESRGSYTAAAEAYKEAARLDPMVPYLWLALGRNYRVLALLVDARYLQDALDAFKRATQVDPNYGPALDELGWTYYNVEDYGQATDVLEQAVKVDPNAWSAQAHLGIAYYSRRNYEAAAEALPRAIELMNQTFDADRHCLNATSRACDRLVEAYYTLGLTDYYLAKCEESYTLFDKVLRLRPQEPNATEGRRLCQEAESSTPKP